MYIYIYIFTYIYIYIVHICLVNLSIFRRMLLMLKDCEAVALEGRHLHHYATQGNALNP